MTIHLRPSAAAHALNDAVQADTRRLGAVFSTSTNTDAVRAARARIKAIRAKLNDLDLALGGEIAKAEAADRIDRKHNAKCELYVPPKEEAVS